MQTALGQIRLGPRASSVPRRGWWSILQCDRDWHGLCEPVFQLRTPGEWVDTGGGKLALVRPRFEVPAWGPHISITRNEKPKQHLDVWRLLQDLGDLEEELMSMRESLRHYEAKAAEYRKTLEDMGPGVRPKFRRQAEASLTEMERTIANRERRIPMLTTDIQKVRSEWGRLRGRLRLPKWFGSGQPLRFEHEDELRLWGSHWGLRVRCDTLGDIRELFGLRRQPRVPFHLTVGVTEG
jgi:flagellar biosynthesis chaperone FliJ